MRRVTVYVLGVLLLVSACGSSDGGGDGAKGDGGEKMSYESVKSSVDDLVSKILPELATTFKGEFPAVRGGFNECGVGPQFQKYSVRGELHAAVEDDAKAAEMIRGVLADAGLDVTIDDDQTVVATQGETRVVMGPAMGRPVGGVTILPLAIDSECQTYNGSDADAMREVPPNDYGSPVTGTS
ncbi:hypothetical protein [Aeromicrobium chenweiae]|uniref:hypothetical protein n=1 Tax=Aeromicrobium chenweiae TaxID=2079793 RepID=UPI00109317F8|nr:hypothetical protein [Aeromicrobium chenweiae]TGN32655.1 hypothetical protein E4L97_08050 [Aeromicrobium chenweiae]